MSKFNIVAVSSLFPNGCEPQHGIFLEHRLKHMSQLPNLAIQVIAPVPYFPFSGKLFGRFAKYAAVPEQEIRSGLQIYHPRYFTLPKVGMYFSPISMAYAALKEIRKIQKSGFKIDVIDSYYLYPDGVAGSILSAILNIPHIQTAFGSDVSFIPNYFIPRKLIQWSCSRASATTAVCLALKDALLKLVPKSTKFHVVEHGVDLELFKPSSDRQALRQQLGWSSTTVLSVGHLIERKGHDLAIRACKSIPNIRLNIIGCGPEEQRLKQLVSDLNLQNQVVFLGQIAQQKLVEYMSAADALVLCSDREGIANVILESIACGTPVAATAVWGAPEVITEKAAGLLIAKRSVEAIAHTLEKLLTSPPDRSETRKFSQKFSWQETASMHFDVLSKSIK